MATSTRARRQRVNAVTDGPTEAARKVLAEKRGPKSAMSVGLALRVIQPGHLQLRSTVQRLLRTVVPDLGFQEDTFFGQGV